MNEQQQEPVLVLSQDYELFFQKSGSIEKCLIEPCEKLLQFAGKFGIAITFFVDAGMLRCFDRHAGSSPEISRAAVRVREHLRAISQAGHELGLHIHPHWEDTRWIDGQWDFSATRYQLRDFSEAEVEDIVRSNFSLLQELSGDALVSYRAGGFCVEPFSQISAVMAELGITAESSVIAGARLVDPHKGFDFAGLADRPWWYFEESPSVPSESGAFIEVPITPNTVSRFFYWGRLLDRIGPARPSGKFGDGVSKAIGKKEIARRLLGGSRTSELSIDDAKASYLTQPCMAEQSRRIWHLMGHPKLLSERSLDALQLFAERAGIRRYVSVSAIAREIRAGAFD